MRLAPLPCSKEVLPIGLEAAPDGSLRPAVAGKHLLGKFRAAGIGSAFFIVRKGKWDIPQYFGDGADVGLDVGYLIMREPYGVPFTVDQAFAFVTGRTVAFGFPDILFDEEDPFPRLLAERQRTQADIVLGLFPVGAATSAADAAKAAAGSGKPATGAAQTADRVEVEASGRVRAVHPASTREDLPRTWGIAVWGPRFTDFNHRHILRLRESCGLIGSGSGSGNGSGRGSSSAERELTMSAAIQAAIEHGLQARAVDVSAAPFLDIGTPEGLAQVIGRR